MRHLMRPGGFETTTSHTEKVRVLRLTGEPVELAVASEATVHELPLGLGIKSEGSGFGILVYNHI